MGVTSFSRALPRLAISCTTSSTRSSSTPTKRVVLPSRRKLPVLAKRVALNPLATRASRIFPTSLSWTTANTSRIDPPPTLQTMPYAVQKFSVDPRRHVFWVPLRVHPHDPFRVLAVQQGEPFTHLGVVVVAHRFHPIAAIPIPFRCIQPEGQI